MTMNLSLRQRRRACKVHRDGVVRSQPGKNNFQIEAKKKIKEWEFPLFMVKQIKDLKLVSVRMWVWSLPSLSGLSSSIVTSCSICHRCGLCHACGMGSRCRSNLTPHPGMSICCRCGQKRKRKKQKDGELHKMKLKELFICDIGFYTESRSFLDPWVILGITWLLWASVSSYKI